MEIRGTGVWLATDGMTARETADFARRVEALGYAAFWFPEILGRNSFVQAGWLLAATERLVVASGIANLYLREPFAARTAQHTLAEQSGGRYLLGLGLSHAPMVEGLLSRDYRSPLATARDYLERMERAQYGGPPPPEAPPAVLAALGPKLLELAAQKTRGAHTYLVPPEHTAQARGVLGAGPWLCVEQKVLLETDASKARAAGRRACAFYLGLQNYQKSMKRLGYGDADLADGGSDRLVDALVAWGDEKAVAARVREHLDAGATHVCIQPLFPDGSAGPEMRAVEALAPGT